jgi:hypothetical protein
MDSYEGVLTAEAVSRRAESGDTFSLKSFDDLVDRGARVLLGVRGEPLADVEVAAGVQRIGGDGVAVQDVGDIGLFRVTSARNIEESHYGRAVDYLESVSGKVIGKELCERKIRLD